MATERWRAKLMEDGSLFPSLRLSSSADPRFGPRNTPIGAKFESRAELQRRGLHTRSYAGISGSAHLGAFSIVISGGYTDDIDNGDSVVYTGTGGQMDPFQARGDQIADQSFEHPHNKALQKSCSTQIPIRVFRGHQANSKWSPKSGYRFDGMYTVERAYVDKGEDGYNICKFHLQRVPGQRPLNEYI